MNGAGRMLGGERLAQISLNSYRQAVSCLLKDGSVLQVSLFCGTNSGNADDRGDCLFHLLGCLEASKHLVISAAAALAWVIWSQSVWNLQISHHWFTTLLFDDFGLGRSQEHPARLGVELDACPFWFCGGCGHHLHADLVAH